MKSKDLRGFWNKENAHKRHGKKTLKVIKLGDPIPKDVQRLIEQARKMKQLTTQPSE